MDEISKKELGIFRAKEAALESLEDYLYFLEKSIDDIPKLVKEDAERRLEQHRREISTKEKEDE